MSQQPNILFILTDQQRADTVGCLHSWMRTPSLDLVAFEGITYTNCITNSPVCLPARVALASGRYPHNFGLWQNVPFDYPLNAPTWMRAIRNCGYRTSIFGKTHLHRKHDNDLRVDEPRLYAYGFDDVNEIVGPRGSTRVLSHMTVLWQKHGVWNAFQRDFEERFSSDPRIVRPSPLPLELYYDVYIAQEAKKYLAEYRRDEPWFCTVSFGGPHEPWDAPEPYASMYVPEEMPPPIPRVNLSERSPSSTLKDRLRLANPISNEHCAAMRANYAGSISLIDDQIGQLIDVIKQRGEWDETVVVFSSDHGEMNGDHGLVYKNTFLNSAVRVPLIIRTPATAATRSGTCRLHTSPVELLDVGATIADLARATLDYHQFGKSLVATLENPKATHRESALSVFKGEFMLLTDEYKLVVNRHGEPYLLFECQEDAFEQRNLCDDPRFSSIRDDLRLRLLDRLVPAQNYCPGSSARVPRFVKNAESMAKRH